ncbi:MAG: peptidylprolyl isomerase, partial [Eggerthellaceae bacterium]|nr:peptidylprolyl isomerase [Eggerthellaceae bacterium]
MNKPQFFKAIATVGVVAACSFGLVACQGGGSAGGTAATVNGTAISEEEVTNTIQTVRTQSGLETEDAW